MHVRLSPKSLRGRRRCHHCFDADDEAVSLVLSTLMEYLKDQCSSKKQAQEVTEASAVDQYDKLCLGVDHIIGFGVRILLASAAQPIQRGGEWRLGRCGRQV